MSKQLTKTLTEADARHAASVRKHAIEYAGQLYAQLTASAPGDWRFDGYEEPPAPEKSFFSSPPPHPPQKRCITWQTDVTDEINRVASALYNGVTPPKHVRHALADEFLGVVKKDLAVCLDNPGQYHVGHKTKGVRDEYGVYTYKYKLCVVFKYEVTK